MKRHTSTTAIVIALSLTTTLFAAPEIKTHSPCDADFSLRVTVTPSEPEGEPKVIGFTLDYKNQAAQGTASRIHTGQKSQFDRATCQKWQEANWGRLGRILYESNQGIRSKLVCHNIASIDYSSKAEKKSAKVCLAGAKQDVVTHAFKSFYNGGDFLIAK